MVENIDDILIVSGGGGGANYRSENYGEGNGGHGGGFVGGNGDSTNHTNDYGYGYGYGGTQTEGGSHFWNGTVDQTKSGLFGQGGGIEIGLNAQSGGGGGFYGGGPGGHGGAGGGSGYIGNSLLANKSMYCYNCTTSNEESTKHTPQHVIMLMLQKIVLKKEMVMQSLLI